MDAKPPSQDEQEIAHEMATLVAAAPTPLTMLDAPPLNNAANAAGSGVNKRYRPAPAKTFQCRGYGDCRMVFSRSEHLARHIRKHTGERPFSCHCGKQFSRLDNLRQHAQTVHADKQDLNDKMMRDLTSLHASMTAATKGGPSRAKRGSANSSSPTDTSSPTDADVKQEDMPTTVPAPRPGTSTGYEGDNGIFPGSSAWHPNSSNPRPANPYSFRDSSSSQSFRTSQHYFGQYPAGQSFLAPSSFATSAGSSLNRSPGDARSLPPIAAVVSSSLSSPPPHPTHPFQPPPPGAAHILPLPTPSVLRRPATSASRPTTAPPSYYSPPPGTPHARQLPFHRAHGPGLGFSSAELSIPVYGGSPKLGGFGSFGDDGPTSPTSGESPFSFHPPALAEPSIPRKRPFPGSDDDGLFNANGEYEYGSDSRPQSRRLSVMELCHDTDTPPPRTAGGESRPGSRSVLSSLSTALDDRPRTASGALLTGDPSTTSRSDASSTPTPETRSAGWHVNHGGSPQTPGRRILQASGDSNRLQSTRPSRSPVLSAARSPGSDATATTALSPRTGFSSPLGATGAPGRESPGSDKVRIASGFAMKA